MNSQKLLGDIVAEITNHLNNGGSYSELVCKGLPISTIRYIHQGKTPNPGILTLGKIAEQLGIGK